MPLNAPVFHFRTSVECMAPGNKRGARPFRSRRAKRNAQLITDARHSPLENWNHRRRVYVWLQLSRVPVLALAGIVMWLTHNLTISVIIAFFSVPLPWIAVLIANQPGESTSAGHKVYKPGLVREQREAVARTQLASAPLRSLAPPPGSYIDHDEAAPPPSRSTPSESSTSSTSSTSSASDHSGSPSSPDPSAPSQGED